MHYVSFAFCLICILSHLHFVTFVFCLICVLLQLHYVLFAFCYICNLTHLHFVTFAFCRVGILSGLHFVCFWRFVLFAFCQICILTWIHPDQVVTGPIYVLKVKSSKAFKSNELLYSIVHKGVSNMGLLLFKEIVEDLNPNFCLTQIVNNRKDTTWDQCLTEAGDIKPKAVHVHS